METAPEQRRIEAEKRAVEIFGARPMRSSIAMEWGYAVGIAFVLVSAFLNPFNLESQWQIGLAVIVFFVCPVLFSMIAQAREERFEDAVHLAYKEMDDQEQ